MQEWLVLAVAMLATGCVAGVLAGLFGIGGGIVIVPVLETVLGLLGVDPDACVVIEDSVAGVRAARAAGMRVIAIPPCHLFDNAAYFDADVKLTSLNEITTETLVSPSR